MEYSKGGVSGRTYRGRDGWGEARRGPRRHARNVGRFEEVRHDLGWRDADSRMLEWKISGVYLRTGGTWRKKHRVLPRVHTATCILH